MGELSELIFDRANVVFPGVLADITREDLLDVADAVSAQPNGLTAAQSIAAQVAPFTEALPNPGHRVIAALILDGAITTLLTNWDDCIERAVFEGCRIQAVVTDHDRLHLAGALLLKIHGCATQVDSLLLTRAQLADPPKWASTEFAAKVSTSSVVFVGLGDIASYAKHRVRELIDSVHNVDHLHVVSPIRSNWEHTEWQALTPGLPDENKTEKPPTSFLTGWRARGFLSPSWGASSQARASGNEQVLSAATVMITSFGTVDALSYIQWLRVSALLWPAGISVVHATATHTGLLALAVLSSGNLVPSEVGQAPILESGETIELIISHGRWAGDIRREAQRRSMAARGERGTLASDARFLSSGHRGLLPETIEVDDITGRS